AEMSGVADGDGGKTPGSATLGEQRHRFAPNHLAVAETAVDGEQRAAVDGDLGMPVGDNLAGGEPGEILGDADDAMAVMPEEIRLDEVVGKHARLVAVRPRGGEDRRDEIRQRAGGDAPHCHGAPSLRLRRRRASSAAYSIASI